MAARKTQQRSTGATEEVATSALFVLWAGESSTEWLEGLLERNREGYVPTGPDLMGDGARP